MPVHDYVISNATGATIRADLNNALSAIVTNNSSNSEPATKYAYMWWADTSAGLLKIRNSSNDGWVTLFQLDGTLTLEDGSNSAPAIGFRDDDNTGIFSSAADNLDITTGGTTRVNVSSAGINVTGTVTDDGASHDGDVTFIGASANINFDKSDNALEFADNAKAVFGNSDDLKIYHDSSDSYVQDSGTGKLVLATNGASVNIYDTANSAQLAKFITGGAVELYHNGSKKLETTSTGMAVTGAITGTAGLSIEGATVFNEAGADVDFRIEGDTDANLFLLDASVDKIGIGAAPVSTGAKLEISRSVTGAFADASDTILRLLNTNNSADTNQTSLEFTTFTTGSGADSAIVSQAEDSSGNSRLEFWTDTNNGMTEKMSIAANGTVNVVGNLDVGAGLDVTGNIIATGQITASGNGITVSGNTASLSLTDDGDDPDYKVQNNNGQFRIFDSTNTANRFSINSSGVVDIAGRLDANGGLNVDGDVTFTGASANIIFDKSDNNLEFADNAKATFGDSQDLQLFHDGSQSVILDNGTGGLQIRGENVISMGDTTGNRVYLQAIKDGTVSLRHNNIVRCETSADGLDLPDNSKLQLGDNQDLVIYHDSAHSYIDNALNDLFIRNTSDDIIIQAQDDFFIRVAGGENAVVALDNGAVELYYDNVKKFETTSSGATVTGNITTTGDVFIPDDKSLFFGNGSDFSLMHRSADNLSIIKEVGGSDLSIETNGSKAQFYDSVNGRNMAEFIVGGACLFKHGATTRLETLSDGVNVTGTLKINGSAISTGGLGNVVEDTTPQLGGALDTNSQNIEFGDVGNTSQNRLKFGAGGDLSIFHNASTSKNFISTIGSNDLSITSRRVDIKNDDDSETLASFIKDGAVELYYDNSKKFETTTFGATVQGGITFGSDTATANQMDDYEEGVFTPSLEFGGATTDITYSSMRGGSYTKIGRQVTVNFGFTLTSKGSASGDATIAGLPFAIEDLLSSTTAEASGVSCFWNDIATNSANIVFVAMGGTSELEIRNTVGAEDDTDTMVDGDFQNNTAIRGSITYFTAT